MKLPYECELCHYRNMNKQDPVYDCKKDEDTFIALCRAQLDVLWARESFIVASNLSRLRQDYIDSTTMFTLGNRVLHYLPSHTVEDMVGIVPAVMTLVASLRPGDYCKNAQPGTARKTSAWHGNAHNAGYLGNSIGTRG